MEIKGGRGSQSRSGTTDDITTGELYRGYGFVKSGANREVTGRYFNGGGVGDLGSRNGDAHIAAVDQQVARDGVACGFGEGEAACAYGGKAGVGVGRGAVIRQGAGTCLGDAACAGNVAAERRRTRGGEGAGGTADGGICAEGQRSGVCRVAQGDVTTNGDRIQNRAGCGAAGGKRAAVEGETARARRAAGDRSDRTSRMSIGADLQEAGGEGGAARVGATGVEIRRSTG